jgi:hypothetical protein
VEDPIPAGTLEWHPGPEAEELARRKAQLLVFSEELQRRERDLDAYRVELHHFETRYRKTLGGRYARLDELADLLDASRGEADGGQRPAPDPEDPADRYPGQGLSGGGQNWDWGEREPEPEPRPVIGEDAKRLFRQLARIIHPDLAGDPAERERRTNLMVAANLAYEQGDVAALEKLLAEWERSPEAVTGSGALVELERTVRRIAQVQTRIDAIDEELAELEASAMGWLRRRTEKAAREGWDLLAHMVRELDRQILEAEVELERRAAAGGPPLAWPDGLTATR